ncbi:MAG TPA: tetratricopeptide repeat protein [Candidatus Methylacidiphilales bacterium]|nr:tetratricopeptide repeat protein [Candidatus Methylacidiphilales bacterium]
MFVIYIVLAILFTGAAMWLLIPRILESRGAVLRNQGDFDAAVSTYSTALKFNPSSAESHIGRGAAQYARGEGESAIVDLTRGLELLEAEGNLKAGMPKTDYDREWATIAFGFRGLARARVGDTQGAFADLDIAVRLSPRDVETREFRARIREKQGDASGARADYDQITTLDPVNITAFRRLTVLRLQENDTTGGMREVERWRQLAPKSATPYAFRAQIYQAMQEEDAAMADYSLYIDAVSPPSSKAAVIHGTASSNGKAAFTIAQTSGKSASLHEDAEQKETETLAIAYHNRAVLRTHKRDFAGARADLGRTLELNPEDQAAQLSMGVCQMQQGDWEPALEACGRVLQMNPKNHTAYHYRNIILQSQGKFDEAVAEANRAIEADEAHDLAYLDRALALTARGDLEKAIEDYTKALELKTQNPALTLYNRGITYLLHGKSLNLAIDDLTAMIKKAPRSAHAYTFRGIARAASGEFAEAMSDFTYAIELAPKNPAAYANRGIAYESIGNFPAAVADYRATIQHGDAYLEALPSSDAPENELAAAVRPVAAVLREDPLNRDPVDFGIVRALDMQHFDQQRFIGIARHSAGDIRGAIALFRNLLPPKLDLIQKRMDAAIKKQWTAA